MGRQLDRYMDKQMNWLMNRQMKRQIRRYFRQKVIFLDRQVDQQKDRWTKIIDLYKERLKDTYRKIDRKRYQKIFVDRQMDRSKDIYRQMYTTRIDRMIYYCVIKTNGLMNHES